MAYNGPPRAELQHIVPGRMVDGRQSRSGTLKMARKVMISCAVTGSADTPGRNPAVPVTPEQIANSCLDAAKAGAAIVHIHVRDPKTTKPSMDKALYRETVERIREKNSDVLINLTTGPGARFFHDDKDPSKPSADSRAARAGRARAARHGDQARHLLARHGQRSTWATGCSSTRRRTSRRWRWPSRTPA